MVKCGVVGGGVWCCLVVWCVVCGVVWCDDRKSPRVLPVEQVEGNSAEVIDATDANLAGSFNSTLKLIFPSRDVPLSENDSISIRN